MVRASDGLPGRSRNKLASGPTTTIRPACFASLDAWLQRSLAHVQEAGAKRVLSPGLGGLMRFRHRAGRPVPNRPLVNGCAEGVHLEGSARGPLCRNMHPHRQWLRALNVQCLGRRHGQGTPHILLSGAYPCTSLSSQEPRSARRMAVDSARTIRYPFPGTGSHGGTPKQMAASGGNPLQGQHRAPDGPHAPA